jgi:uncharacterized membrane protein YeaQ/YmgE (transglycosylase-associated protein family)
MTIEHLVQMGPMWITAGLTIAWLAQAGWRAGAHGLLIDIALGVVGAIAVGMAAGAAIASDVGMLAMFAIGAVGAIVLIAAQRRLRPSHVEPGASESGTVMTPAVRRVS